MGLLESMFWFSALLGGAFLVVSTVFGGHTLAGGLHVPFVHVPHLHLGGQFVPSSGTASVTPILLAFLTLFGLGGLLGLHDLALPGAGAIGVGLALGVLGAGIAFALFALLQRFEAAEPTALASLAGRSAVVAVSITHGRPGQVKLLVDGALRSFTAVSTDELRTGEPALIVAIDGVRLVVRRPTA